MSDRSISGARFDEDDEEDYEDEPAEDEYGKPIIESYDIVLQEKSGEMIFEDKFPEAMKTELDNLIQKYFTVEWL